MAQQFCGPSRPTSGFYGSVGGAGEGQKNFYRHPCIRLQRHGMARSVLPLFFARPRPKIDGKNKRVPGDVPSCLPLIFRRHRLKADPRCRSACSSDRKIRGRVRLEPRPDRRAITKETARSSTLHGGRDGLRHNTAQQCSGLGVREGEGWRSLKSSAVHYIMKIPSSESSPSRSNPAAQIASRLDAILLRQDGRPRDGIQTWA